MTSQASSKIQFLITCEHATSFIPKPEQEWLQIPKAVLNSHRGWDKGAANVAAEMSKQLDCKLILGGHSRLMCDLNRTSENKAVFSEFTKSLSPHEKQRVLKKYHEPHWEKVRKSILKKTEKNEVLIHIGVHSFTPIYENYTRPTDLGILYDPKRGLEKDLALKWQKALKKITRFQVDLNRPYRGTGNGLVTDLRTRFQDNLYLGFEIELNQRVLSTETKQRAWATQLTQSLLAIIGD